MKNLRRLISVSLTIAAVAIGMTMTAGTAQAGVITFGVEESVVTGATNTNLGGVDVTANGITAKYREEVVLGPGNAFTGDILVLFSAYTMNGVTVGSQIGAPDPTDTPANLYVMYGLVQVTGTYSSAVVFGQTITAFDVATATAKIYVDPSRDATGNYTVPSVTDGNGDDKLVLSASLVSPFPDSNGFVIQNSTGAVVGGSYALLFTDPTLTAFGGMYWPDLAALNLTFAVASGDVDPAIEGSIFPGDVRGDSSISFLDGNPVPEPASLLLLGGGLLGLAARRRRAKK